MIKITLPLPPNRGNQSRGEAKWEWARKRKYIEGTKRSVGARTLARSQMIGTDLPLGHTVAHFHFYLGNLMDDDNLMSRCKWPLDALVKAGILVDDKRPHCKVVTEQSVDRKNKRVEIRLEEI